MSAASNSYVPALVHLSTRYGPTVRGSSLEVRVWSVIMTVDPMGIDGALARLWVSFELAIPRVSWTVLSMVG